MIQVQNISLTLGSFQVFDQISFKVQKSKHIGLIGRNGSGKSTLLKVISGLIKPDEGIITLSNDISIAYMPQEIVLESDKTIFNECMSVFKKYLDIEYEINRFENIFNQEGKDLNKSLDNKDIDLDRYIQLQEQLKFFNKHHAISKAKSILLGLGFKVEVLDKTVNTLSVGWRMRLVLAKLLLQEADFYLFDEPTNHLDISAKDWFFDFIKNTNSGFLLVSHDKYFLDGVCNDIIELENKNANKYSGNFSDYLIRKEKQKEDKYIKYKQQQKDISKKKDTINRFKASATKSKMAQSMLRQLNKIDLIKLEPELPTINIKFPNIKRSGLKVLAIEKLRQGFNNKDIFNNISLTINRSERVALIAPNGTGKTTLFNTIINKIKPISGSIDFGHNVEYAVFEQNQLKALDLNKTIFQEVRDSVDSNDFMIKSFLGAFLFTGEDIDKYISVLSGGERNRVAMVKVLLQNANFLLLDEPTNHLDLYSKNALAQALKQYPGTLLISSHDQDFLNMIADRILELTPDEIIDYKGTYSEYKDFKKRYKGRDNNNKDFSHNLKSNKQNKKDVNAYGCKKKYRQLESKIGKLEHKISTINNKLYSLNYGSDEFNKLYDQLGNYQKELDISIEKWEELFNIIEN